MVSSFETLLNKRKVHMKRLSLLLAFTAFMILAASMALAAQKPIVLKMSNQVSADTALNVSLVHMAGILDKKSGGTMKMEVFPAGQLGNNRETLEQLQIGILEMQTPSMGPLAGFNKAGEFLDMPFLFSDDAVAERILDGEVGDWIFAELVKSNYIGLAWWTQGWRHLTTTSREVREPADMKGLKIRVMDNPLHIALFKALGATPVPMAYTELLAGLQQGVVDGQENPYMNIKLSGFWEVQKFIIETGHIYDPVPILVSKPIWEKLTPQQQTWLRESAIEGRDHQRELTRKMDADIKAELKKIGRNVIIELTPEQKAAFRKAMDPIYKERSPQFGGMLEKIETLQKQ